MPLSRNRRYDTTSRRRFQDGNLSTQASRLSLSAPSRWLYFVFACVVVEKPDALNALIAFAICHPLTCLRGDRVESTPRAPVGYEVSRLPHAEQYTTNSPTPPLLLHQWGQTLPTPLPAVSLWHGHNYATTPTLPMGTLLIPVEDSPVADPSLLKQRHKTSCIVVKYVTQIRFRKMCGT